MMRYTYAHTLTNLLDVRQGAVVREIAISADGGIMATGDTAINPQKWLQ